MIRFVSFVLLAAVLVASPARANMDDSMAAMAGLGAMASQVHADPEVVGGAKHIPPEVLAAEEAEESHKRSVAEEASEQAAKLDQEENEKRREENEKLIEAAAAKRREENAKQLEAESAREEADKAARRAEEEEKDAARKQEEEADKDKVRRQKEEAQKDMARKQEEEAEKEAAARKQKEESKKDSERKQKEEAEKDAERKQKEEAKKKQRKKQKKKKEKEKEKKKEKKDKEEREKKKEDQARKKKSTLSRRAQRQEERQQEPENPAKAPSPGDLRDAPVVEYKFAAPIGIVDACADAYGKSYQGKRLQAALNRAGKVGGPGTEFPCPNKPACGSSEPSASTGANAVTISLDEARLKTKSAKLAHKSDPRNKDLKRAYDEAKRIENAVRARDKAKHEASSSSSSSSASLKEKVACAPLDNSLRCARLGFNAAEGEVCSKCDTLAAERLKRPHRYTKKCNKPLFISMCPGSCQGADKLAPPFKNVIVPASRVADIMDARSNTPSSDGGKDDSEAAAAPKEGRSRRSRRQPREEL